MEQIEKYDQYKALKHSVLLSLIHSIPLRSQCQDSPSQIENMRESQMNPTHCLISSESDNCKSQFSKQMSHENNFSNLMSLTLDIDNNHRHFKVWLPIIKYIAVTTCCHKQNIFFLSHQPNQARNGLSHTYRHNGLLKLLCRS